MEESMAGDLVDLCKDLFTLEGLPPEDAAFIRDNMLQIQADTQMHEEYVAGLLEKLLGEADE